MSEKYTRGPWKTEGEGIHALIRGGDATIVAVRHRLPADVHEANARLIAAAPELLEALMLAESVYRQNCVNEGEPSSVLDAMQAAILKATGEKA